jgi:drug/metabolite transporter (DMT)-like permease
MSTIGDQLPVRAASSRDLAALAAGLVTVTLWGSSFVAIRDAGQTLSPGSLALGRLLVSLVVLGVAALVWREPLPERRDLLGIAAFGVLWLGVYSFTLNEAERRVDAGTASMLINIGPVLFAVLAGIFLKEGFPRWLFAGDAVAFSGCVLIGLASSQSGSRAGLGIALLVVAALAYAAAVVIQKPLLARVSPLQVTWLGAAPPAPSSASRSRPRSYASSTTRGRPRSAGRCTSVSLRQRSASRPGRTRCDGRVPAAWALSPT